MTQQNDLMSEVDVLQRWPALSKSGLRAARHGGRIAWVKGKRGSAWYRPSAIETFITEELEQPCHDLAKKLSSNSGQWIAREAGKAFLYRYWHDAGTGHSRRASLGTADIEEAKRLLAEIVVRGEVKTANSHLSVALENYFLNKTDHLVSAGTARNAGRLMLECWGDLVLTGDLNEAKQKKFVKYSMELGHALATIARNLGVLAAALAHAKLQIDVIYNEGAILTKWPEIKPKAPRKIYEPTDEELARLLRAPIPDDLRCWLLNSMATGGGAPGGGS
jgi:hypothetical protein